MQKSSQLPLVAISNLDDIDEEFKGLPGIRDSTNNSDESKIYPENNTLMELSHRLLPKLLLKQINTLMELPHKFFQNHCSTN